MRIKVYHSSDEHGCYVPLAEFAEKHGQPDVWILSGDFFPNLTRGEKLMEVPYQTGYFHASLPVLKRAFGKTPILVQSGNHDYADLVSLLHHHLFQAHEVGLQRQSLALSDGRSFTYAGFREIPYIQGEWNGEADAATLAGRVDQVVGESPDVLINHAPPNGIMDGPGYGVASLTSQLMYREHKIKAVLYGHQHWIGEGKPRIVVENGIVFSNAATTVQEVVLDLD